MQLYSNVKGVGKTMEECRASYNQALEDAGIDPVIHRKALKNYSIRKKEDGTWEQKPSQACFVYDE
tara:strand:- start:223 stop:420 length:198 start_codon:yes stop_codon:yes gene_type:complete